MIDRLTLGNKLMIDVKRIVDNKQEIQDALSKRMDVKDMHLDEIISLYNDKKQIQSEYEEKRREQRSFNDKVATIQKETDEFKKLVKDLKELSLETKRLEEELNKVESKLTDLIEVLPNIPDKDVPAGGKESNVVVKEVGEKPLFDFEIKDHVQLGKELNLFDFTRASKLSGNNFSLYTGMGARLEWALLNYFVDEHIKDGYEMVLTPHIVNEQSGYATGQLPKFKDDVYWIKDEKKFLIPTSETSLTNLFRDEILDEKDLPKKYFSYTPCYRREAGSYRANERGLIRVHQFNKVEMYQFTTKETSDRGLDELVKKAEQLVEKLGLHFRTTKLAAGDCSAGAAKTYDIEAWIPSLEQYYEVSSASNVRDYQARRGNMRYKPTDGEKTEYLHTLNASGLATSRLMVSLVETYQQRDDSILIPEVLQRYIGTDKIVKE